jgi:hypothetical protein
MSSNFEKVSDHIEECIVNLSVAELNPAKLFTLTIQTIEYLDNEYQNLTGIEKRELLIEAFNDLCHTTKHKSLNEEIKNNIRYFISNDLDTVIESVIKLSKGDFQINQKQQKMIIRCLLKLCQCIIKKTNKQERP